MLLQLNPLLTLALVLVAGTVFGRLAQQMQLPSVTGQILIGIALGPSALAVFDTHSIEELQPVTHFALGLIAVTVGNHLNFRRLHNAFTRLGLLVALESTLTPAIVLTGVLLIRPGDWVLALLLAAMCVSTAPATIIAIVRDTHSKGAFVKTLVAAVALNNMACIFLFEMAHGITRSHLNGNTPGLGAILADPAMEILASAALGVSAGLLLIGATLRTVRSERLAAKAVIAILLTAGLAQHWQVSAMLACMFLGLTLANVTPNREELGHSALRNFEGVIYTTFFTLAGMELQLEYAILGGTLAVGVMLLRAAGKYLSASIAMRAAKATRGLRNYLGLALIPQAGVAVGLVILVQGDPAMAPVKDLFLAVGVTVVVLNEIVGPVCTRLALARAGDLGKDRPRLIDFLHEENIITDLSATTPAAAIERLVDLMIRTHHLKVDRQQFLDSVLRREHEFSTAVGGGLAIPHGTLNEGNAIVGVMGISREGLYFDTPDGQPIHCMVLLATPPAQRDRHLEVIAALALAVGHDRNIQRELYSAKSPAHAYELLHTEEAEDFNYFLEDTATV